MSNNNWHVCSLIVQSNPKELARVKDMLLAIPGTEVPGFNEDEGKLVVVMQAEDSDLLYAKIESIRDFPGVLAVSLVYHQQDEQGEEIA